MATKHWVRDVLLTDLQFNVAGGNHLRANAILFHFLRVANFDWLWECGNQFALTQIDANFVPDGAMEQSGVTNWTATGAATRAKVTTPVRSGTQALSVDPTAGAGGVRTAALTAQNPVTDTTGTGDSLSGPDAQGIMTYTGTAFGADGRTVGQEFEMSGSSQSGNNGRFPIVAYPDGSTQNKVKFYNPNGVAESYTTGVYEVDITVRVIMMTSLWVSNNTGTLNVSVDRGDGSPTVVGTIPNNGGTYTRYNFSWSYQGSGTPYIYVENPSSGSAFYIDSIITWRSAWEYYMARDEAVASPDTAHYGFTGNLAVNHYGVDGNLTNPDQFSTGAGDGYSPGAADVGKHLVVWDGTNNKNSGVYEIIADVGGGVVQVNLRSASAAFVTTTGLKWRIIDIQQFQGTSGAGTYTNQYMPEWIQTAGFGLESPHTTSWRFFLRQNQASTTTQKSSEMWSAPEDTDFNQNTGHFYLTGPSVMRSRAQQWTRNVTSSGNNSRMHVWRGPYVNASSTMTTRTFLMTDENLSFFNLVHWDNDAGGEHGCFFVGYHETDPDHPGKMAFVHLSRWEDISIDNEIDWDDDTGRFAFQGTGFDYSGQAVRCCAAQQMYDASSKAALEQSNAAANPWSGEEWLQELRLANDPEAESGGPSERDAGAGLGIFQGRYNLADLSTIDSNTYLHFTQGYVWEWSGESLVP